MRLRLVTVRSKTFPCACLAADVAHRLDETSARKLPDCYRSSSCSHLREGGTMSSRLFTDCSGRAKGVAMIDSKADVPAAKDIAGV